MDYSESLIKINAAIKDYRLAMLSGDMKCALYWSKRILEFADDLYLWTDSKEMDLYSE